MSTPLEPVTPPVAPPVTASDRPMLSARLLGRFAVALDGHPVDTQSSRRTRNVLAYLFVHRRAPVSRDVLMDVFWPNVAPAAARNSLHVALTGARNALRGCCPTPVLARNYDTYEIAPDIDVWVDVEEFERHCRAGVAAERAGDGRQAVASFERANQLYDGDFLADDPYAEWAAPTRDTLQILAQDVQSRLVTLYARRSDHAAALQLGRWILTSDPCNEGVHRQLMSSYATTGCGHLALAQYHRCADALWATFRVGPAPETRALYEHLRAHTVRLDRTA
jgi:DNA-binding SARP family transcriptional activator